MEWLLLLGVSTGMRTMTAMAVLCWFAYLGKTPVHGWAFWAANLVSAIVFTVAALGEYVGDTLPKCPNRTDLGPAAARMVFGGLVGALGANIMHEPAVGGVILGVGGAAIGTWGGIRLRALLTRLLRNALAAALVESGGALVLAFCCLKELAFFVFIFSKWWV